MDSLFEDIYFYLFSFLNDNVTLLLLCQINKKFYHLCSIFGKQNNISKVLSCTNIVENGTFTLAVPAKVKMYSNKLSWKLSLLEHLEVLKWARENKYEWDIWTCIVAVTHGHLELLKWAYENECPRYEYICYLHVDMDS